MVLPVCGKQDTNTSSASSDITRERCNQPDTNDLNSLLTNNLNHVATISQNISHRKISISPVFSESDEISIIINNLFKGDDKTNDIVLTYYKIKLLINYDNRYNLDYIIHYLEMSKLLKNILASQNIKQYQYIVDLLYFKSTTGITPEQNNKLIKFIGIIANAMLQLPKSSDKELIILINKFYTLLSCYIENNICAVADILSLILKSNHPDFFFDLHLNTKYPTYDCSYKTQNNYLALLATIAKTENKLSNSQIYESIAFNLLRKSLIHIKKILKEEPTKTFYAYISASFKKIIDHLKIENKNEILTIIFNDATISSTFKQYLFITLTNCDPPIEINKRIYNIDNKEITDFIKIDIEQQLRYILSENPIKMEVYNLTDHEYDKIREIFQLFEQKSTNKKQYVISCENKTASENWILLHKRAEAINNYDRTNPNFKKNQYLSIIKILHLYNTDATLFYLHNNFTFLTEVILYGNNNLKNQLILLLFSKITRTKLTQSQAVLAFKVLENIFSYLSSNNINDVNLYNKFYQTLSCLVNYISKDNFYKLLHKIIFSQFNSNFFKITNKNDELINNYLTLLSKIAEKEQDLAVKNNLDLPSLTLSLLPYIKDPIKSEQISYFNAVMIAVNIIEIIKHFCAFDRDNIIDIIYNDKCVSQRFKKVFFLSLYHYHIANNLSYCHVEDQEYLEISEIIISINSINFNKIQIPDKILSDSENSILAKFDQYELPRLKRWSF